MSAKNQSTPAAPLTADLPQNLRRRASARPVSGRRATSLSRRNAPSLDGGFRACFLELLLDGLGFVFLHAFLDGARRALDEILRFLQAKAGHCADDLDDGDLVLAERIHHDVELGLLLDGCGSSGTATCG